MSSESEDNIDETRQYIEDLVGGEDLHEIETTAKERKQNIKSYWELIIRRMKPNLRPATYRQYSTALTRVCTMAKVPQDVESFVTEMDKVIKYLLSVTVAQTRKTFLNPIIVAMKGSKIPDKHIQPYIVLRDDCNDKYFAERSSGKLTQKDEERMITLDEWDELIEKLHGKIMEKGIEDKKILGKRDYDLFLTYFLIKLYRSYPLRADFALMKVVNPTQLKRLQKEDDFDDYNYCVLGLRNSKVAHLRLENYKTKGTYGTKVIDLDEATVDLIKEMLSHSRNKTMLVVNHAGVPLNRNQLCKYMIRGFENHTGKPTSINMLRKSYLSDKYADVKEEQQKDAAIMGHSVGTQQNLYVRKGTIPDPRLELKKE